MMRVYISGPMRGHPDFNFPQFDHLAKFLRAEAFDVFSPAEHDREVYPDIEQWPGYALGNADACPKFSYPTSMKWDLQTIIECDAIALLPDWWHSTGAKFERFVAEQLDKLIYVAMPLITEGEVGWHVFPDLEKRMVPPTASSVVVHHE